MKIGKMTDRITFKQITDASKNAGGKTGSYSDYYTDWAEVKEINQMRALQYGIVENFKSYEIYIKNRRDKTLTNNMLITHEGIDLTIHGILEVDEFQTKIIAYHG